MDCFTDNAFAYDNVPVNKASENYPDWWLDLEEQYKVKNFSDAIKRIGPNKDKIRNMKRCWGFTELFRRGFMIRSWGDIMFSVTEDDFKFVYMNSNAVTTHEASQYGNAFKNFHHIKVLSPWVLKEKEGIPFVDVGTSYNNEDIDIRPCVGVLQFNISHGTHVNMFIPRRKYEFMIPFGRPLSHLIPLRDDVDIEYRHHLVTTAEVQNITSKSTASFFGIYSVNKFLKKEKAKRGKCPF